MTKNYYDITFFIVFLVSAVGLFFFNNKSAHDTRPVFERIQLSNDFYGEGAAIGDLNGNGHPDVVCGPYWYEGPDFESRNAFYAEPTTFNILRYGDSNTLAVFDVNGNGWNDILVVGWRGQEAFWYENPGESGLVTSSGTEESGWQRHVIYPNVDNEAAAFYDMTNDGKLELVFHTDGYLGYAQVDSSNPTAPWTFNRIFSEQRDWGPWQHGLGVGDITGNGHKDIMMSEGWWENPGSGEDGSDWIHHPVDFGPGGMQMYAYDVDGDGLNDVITTLEAHGWGLAWFRQVRLRDEIHFEKNLIMGSRMSDNPYGVRFSQPHALVIADLNGNGLADLISGKRYFAHGPTGDPEPLAPAVLYSFVLERGTDEDGQVNFIPYLIDDDSGVGNQFAVGDLTGNGYPDIATCNKKGGFVFLNQTHNTKLKN